MKKGHIRPDGARVLFLCGAHFLSIYTQCTHLSIGKYVRRSAHVPRSAFVRSMFHFTDRWPRRYCVCACAPDIRSTPSELSHGTCVLIRSLSLREIIRYHCLHISLLLQSDGSYGARVPPFAYRKRLSDTANSIKLLILVMMFSSTE